MLFKERSLEKELLDLGPEYYSHKEYTECLKKLFWLNKFLGFYQSTVNFLRRNGPTSTLLDVGCGGGLFILHLSKVFPQMQMCGIDVSSAAIADAQQSLQQWQSKNPKVKVSFHLQEQANLAVANNNFDFILATLVCHHMSNDELIDFLQHAHLAANKAVIINDLQRHPLAYWLYRLFSPVLGNRLINHDGLLSIRRGFIRKEWQLLLQKANIKNYQLKWRFPFRWQLVLWK